MEVILKAVKQLFTLVFIIGPLDLLGIVILPFVLVFLKRDALQLPKLFRFFDNYESYYMDHGSTALDGLSGPNYYRERNSIDLENDPWYKIVWYRYNWLALRNPTNYFQYMYLGAKINYSNTEEYKYLLKDLEGNEKKYWEHDIHIHGGVEKITVRLKNGKFYFGYYKIIPYGKNGKGLRIRVGHKIQEWPKLEKRPRTQWVFTINPFYTMRKD